MKSYRYYYQVWINAINTVEIFDDTKILVWPRKYNYITLSSKDHFLCSQNLFHTFPLSVPIVSDTFNIFGYLLLTPFEPDRNPVRKVKSSSLSWTVSFSSSCFPLLLINPSTTKALGISVVGSELNQWR